MKRRFAIRFNDLRAQVLLWTILPLVISLILFSFTGIGTHQSSMRALAAEENARLARTLSNAVSSALDRYRIGFEAIAALEVHHLSNLEIAQQHLTEMSQIWQGVSLFLVDNEGTILTGSLPYPEWADQALKQFKLEAGVSTQPLMTTADRRIILLGLPVEGSATWLLGGIPVSALGLDQISGFEHPVSDTTMVVVDQAGYIVFGTGSAITGTQAGNLPGVAEALAGEQGIRFVPAQDDENIVAYTPVLGTDWALIVREPWHSLTAPLIRFEQAMPLILLIATVSSLLVLYFGVRYVVRPLRLLQSQVKRVEQGDFEAVAQPVGGVNEIEELRQGMNHMTHQVQHYQAALQDYLRALTHAQEEERARLGRDLHDETIQTLITLSHKAQMIERDLLDQNLTKMNEHVTSLDQMIGAAIEEVRRFSRALRPLYLEELGLVPAMEMLAREGGAVFQVLGSPYRLKIEKELALYRIAQESLNNARRHAKAQHISLELSFLEAHVSLRIHDDGTGFAVPANLNDLTRTGHFGLMGMRERAQLGGGRMDIVSSPTQGTAITVKIAR